MSSHRYCVAARFGVCVLLVTAWGSAAIADSSKPDLSTPEAALRAFVEAQKRGDVTAMISVATVEHQRAYEAFQRFMKERKRSIEVKPQNVYDKLDVITVKKGETLAFVTAKVAYNKEWLAQHVKQSEAVRRSKSGFFVADAPASIQWDEPIENASDGTGYLIAALMFEGGGWKFRTGMAMKDQNHIEDFIAFISKRTGR